LYPTPAHDAHNPQRPDHVPSYLSATKSYGRDLAKPPEQPKTSRTNATTQRDRAIPPRNRNSIIANDTANRPRHAQRKEILSAAPVDDRNACATREFGSRRRFAPLRLVMRRREREPRPRLVGDQGK
jgi:hypothetical protein